MLRHIATFRWKAGTTAAQVAGVQAALDALPAVVPALRAYVHGPDLGLGEGRWDYCVTADVDDAQGYADYDSHPAHQAVRTDVVGPPLAERALVQLEVRASP